MDNDSNQTDEKGSAKPAPPIAKFFQYDHLPEGKLRDTSKKFCDLADHLINDLPPSAELSAGLRKLLEAKDCAVRAAL